MAMMEQVIDYDESSNSNSRFDTSDCSTDAADLVSGTAGTKQTVKSFGFVFHSFHKYVGVKSQTSIILNVTNANYATTRKMFIVQNPNCRVLLHLT